MKIEAVFTPSFKWNDRLCSGPQKFWIFVEDTNENMILHYEQLLFVKKKVYF